MGLSAPAPTGDQLNQADVENHTLIVGPTEFIPHIPTVHTKPGEQSPAIRCNVVDLSDPSGQPVLYTGVLWFGVISNSLKRQLGETILARMTKGTASPGKNAPWQLADIMSEQAWVDYANQWLATPAGQEWEVAVINEVNRAAAAAQLAGAAAPTQGAAPAAAPVASAPPAPAPVAGPPAAAPVPAGPPAVAGPPSAPAPAAAPAIPAGLEALLAAMPADQQAAARALMAQQGQAAS